LAHKRIIRRQKNVEFHIVCKLPQIIVIEKAVDKNWIGPDRIGPDLTDKTWIGSDRTHKTWIGSNSIKETHIYSLKVGAFQIPTKNGQGVSLDQDDEQESDCHCTDCAFSSPFCHRS